VNTRGSDQAAQKSDKKNISSQKNKLPLKTASPRAENPPTHPGKPASAKAAKAPEGNQKKVLIEDPIIVHHLNSPSDEPPRRSIFKSTFNTSDIMHAPVEKTIQMLDKILAGERLFTM
jgi:hypothetical protein